MPFPSEKAERTCVGCRSKKKASVMGRLVLDSQGDEASLHWDKTGRRPGRGAWLCLAEGLLSEKCLLEAFKKRAFNRAFKFPGAIKNNPPG